jgi:hypothetical protein
MVDLVRPGGRSRPGGDKTSTRTTEAGDDSGGGGSDDGNRGSGSGRSGSSGDG